MEGNPRVRRFLRFTENIIINIPGNKFKLCYINRSISLKPSSHLEAVLILNFQAKADGLVTLSSIEKHKKFKSISQCKKGLRKELWELINGESKVKNTA